MTWPPPRPGDAPPPRPAPASDPPPAGGDRPAGGRWPARFVWGPVVALVAAVAVLIAVALTLVPLLDDRLAGAIAEFGSGLVILLAALWLWRTLAPAPRDETLDSRASPARVAVAGIACGVGLIVVQGIVVVTGAAIDPGVRRAMDDPDNRVDLNLPAPALALSLVALVVLAPLGEELLFRGLLLRGIWSRLGFGWGCALSSLAFGLAHLDPWFTGIWPRSIALVLVGVGLALVYRRWGYATAVAAHATVNAVAVIALLAA